MKYTVNSDRSKVEFMLEMEKLYDKHKHLRIEVKAGDIRTTQQRKALEVYCDGMANELNNRGIDYVKWSEHKANCGIETMWTQELFKDVFREYAATMFPEIRNKDGKASTTKITREKMTTVYDLVNSRMSILFGCGLPWPEKKDGA